MYQIKYKKKSNVYSMFGIVFCTTVRLAIVYSANHSLNHIVRNGSKVNYSGKISQVKKPCMRWKITAFLFNKHCKILLYQVRCELNALTELQVNISCYILEWIKSKDQENIEPVPNRILQTNFNTNIFFFYPSENTSTTV